MAQRFNPPPNWPAPPEGWTPPPGWQPDPSWGPPPPGWRLWVKNRPNTDAAKWSFIAGGVLFVVLLLIRTALVGPPPPEAIGEVFARSLVSALLTWWVAAKSSGRWPRWAYPLVVIGFSLLLGAISAAGQAGNTA